MDARNFRGILEKINGKSGKTMFDMTKIAGVERTLGSLQNLVYLGHGVQSICFKVPSQHPYVVKCCLKRKQSILQSGSLFLSTSQDLVEKGIPILAPMGVLYDDDVWLIYSQPMCRIIEEVNVKLTYLIVQFVRQMVEHNIRISDVFYRNFGIYQNTVRMFDYHDLDHFESSSNFLITNLYTLFARLGISMGWKVPETLIAHWDQIVADRFGKSRFPEVLVDLLCALHMKERETILSASDQVLIYLKKHIPLKLNSFPKITLDSNEMILLAYPNQVYGQIFTLIQKTKIRRVLDIHSTETGLGPKLAQDFPNLQVGLGCRNADEIRDATCLINNCLIFNAFIVPGNLLEIKVSVTESYDLVLYSISIYHLLHTYKINDLLKILRNHVSHYFLIEIPIEGDDLLSNVSHLPNFDCLKSPHIFRAHLCAQRFVVNRCLYVDYGQLHTKRFLFLCETL